MGKKYKAKHSDVGFWSKLAALWAPQDEIILHTTRSLQKVHDKKEDKKRRKGAPTSELTTLAGR
ncbi:hypothetical protein [Kordiimonas sp.]|uniref:hypothetical protein n=1 Tax=Kordiimonas sp. TaxID=1970157 RepID=UPI003A90B592